ncbi:hypothetical protein C8F04DRAFT_1091509 [Mycena alexandri]|uniref:Fungal-type protein kinase domain-containing protein n=1 Tax=Mycena alexandri TaxID=1745969 RepID=A0AAD6T5N8_9AGAR|nr:hypothetical protein C8F04DRAFT_1091509 [Mycena alexandri]
MALANFAGIVPVQEFMTKYMPPPTSEGSTIADIVKHPNVVAALNEFKEAAMKAKDENGDAKQFIAYLEKIVFGFPPERKPFIGDTRKTEFKSLNEGHYKMPDITASRPGLKTLPKAWHDAGTVVELKHTLDIFDDEEQIIDSESDQAIKALIQLAKSARSLLMASNACYVYVVSAFRHGMARIFRFDHSGFRATSAFNWTTEPTILPTFFFRLYNPDGDGGRMYGDDDTISIPTTKEKVQMYDALCTHSFYNRMYESQEEATKNSLWIKAVRFDDVNGERVPKIVRAFTIGSILSYSDGLFSRATHVYRVILEDDVEQKVEQPPIYALKDVWRQACRRPEIDFYDTIAKHCSANNVQMDGMVRCHGSIDLSVSNRPPAPTWDWTRHRTCSATKGPSFDRCHTRALFTPVGKPLKFFPSTKALVQALHHAILHHEIAFQAGVLQRDVSDGNVLFEEASAEADPKGFLVDWDYAEFTPEGLRNFESWFPGRKDEQDQYKNIDKSLKDITGTLPFMAIQILDNENMAESDRVSHQPCHDLESIYWLLVWMILRHTKHTHPAGALACSQLFDPTGTLSKRGWSTWRTPVNPQLPLFELVEGLREQVSAQNRIPNTGKYQMGPEPLPITYEAFRRIFDAELAAPGWPTNDAMIPFRIPSLKTANNQSEARSLIVETLQRATRGSAQGSGSLPSAQGSGSLKRSRDGDIDNDPFTAAPASGSKDAPDVRKAKKQKGKLQS